MSYFIRELNFLIPKFPVKLDKGIIIYGTEEPFKFEDAKMYNGVDDNEDIVTNIRGFDGDELLKWCPHCKEVLISSDFGPEGRPDHEHGRRRDQSWCVVCRKESRGK